MLNVLQSLNSSLQHALETDERVYVLGEDILDPYGGAFKVTRGLSTRFPDRVLTTPISEAAIVGIASGMAIRGLRPVVEIMFGDFVSLAADQIINHAAKFRWMYNNKVCVPIVIRSPMGGGRGYGPTHSQSLEKIFLGVPGLKVVAPNCLGNPGQLLETAIADDDPVLFVEHKLLYTRPLLEQGRGLLAEFAVKQTSDSYPNFLVHVPGQAAHLTIATYGYTFELVMAAANDLLMKHEIFTEIVLFSQLSPFDIGLLVESLRKTNKLLTVEEGTRTLGWGAEIATLAAEEINNLVIRRVAALDLPIANSKGLEDLILPSVKDVFDVSLEIAGK